MSKCSYSLHVALAVFAFLVINQASAQQYIRISQSDGTTVEIALADIQKITFDNLVSVQMQNPVVQQLLKMKLYPNPAREFVNIAYTLQAGGEVTIEIFTLNGNLLKISNQGLQPAGDYNYRWPTTGVTAGSYLCIIKQNQEMVSEKVIIKN